MFFSFSKNSLFPLHIDILPNRHKYIHGRAFALNILKNKNKAEKNDWHEQLANINNKKKIVCIIKKTYCKEHRKKTTHI